MTCIHLAHLLPSCYHIFILDISAFALHCTRSTLYIQAPFVHHRLPPTPTKSLSRPLLSGSVSFPCFPFCTVSLCSPHKTSSVLHPRLSICATHLCCFAAVTEAHILIAARWGKLAAYTHTRTCTTCLQAHTHTHTHTHTLSLSSLEQWCI